jgi:hypothetical protein
MGAGTGATSFPHPRRPVASRLAVPTRRRRTPKSSSWGRERKNARIRPVIPACVGSSSVGARCVRWLGRGVICRSGDADLANYSL